MCTYLLVVGKTLFTLYVINYLYEIDVCTHSVLHFNTYCEMALLFSYWLAHANFISGILKYRYHLQKIATYTLKMIFFFIMTNSLATKSLFWYINPTGTGELLKGYSCYIRTNYYPINCLLADRISCKEISAIT